MKTLNSKDLVTPASISETCKMFTLSNFINPNITCLPLSVEAFRTKFREDKTNREYFLYLKRNKHKHTYGTHGNVENWYEAAMLESL